MNVFLTDQIKIATTAYCNLLAHKAIVDAHALTCEKDDEVIEMLSTSLNERLIKRRAELKRLNKCLKEIN